MKYLPFFLLWVLSMPVVYAQGGAAIRAAGELVEALGRRGASESAEATARGLAAFGGTRAVREVLEHASREGGEVMMRQVAQLTEKHGILALQALKGAPGPVIRAVHGVPAEWTEKSLMALVREPAAMRNLATQFGSNALETAARHPGLAVPIGSRLGSEGLDTARRLNLDEAAALSRRSGDLAALPAPERSAFLQMVQRAPAKTLAWMEKHPRLLVAGSATTAVVLARKEIFGEGAQQGLLERATASLYRAFEKPIHLVLGVLFAVTLGWAAFKVLAISRGFRRRSRDPLASGAAR